MRQFQWTDENGAMAKTWNFSNRMSTEMAARRRAVAAHGRSGRNSKHLKNGKVFVRRLRVHRRIVVRPSIDTSTHQRKKNNDREEIDGSFFACLFQTEKCAEIIICASLYYNQIDRMAL